MWTPIISYVDLDDHLRKLCTSCEPAFLEAWQANEGLCRCLGDKLLIIWPTGGYVITDFQGSIAMNALL